MKRLIYIIFFLIFSATGCTTFEELENDPNRPGQVPPSMIFTKIIQSMVYYPWSDEQRWNQFWCSNYAYYDDNEYDWTTTNYSYSVLNDVKQMVAEAERVGLPANNPYSAIGKFFKAYFSVDMTMKVGDIPLNEAMSGLNNITPSYDAQKVVFQQALTWLEESNDDLQELINNLDNSLSGDFMLGNDLTKWQKVVNAYKLRVLITLSKKESDNDLKIKQAFNSVLSNPSKYPLMTSLDDNLTYRFNSSTEKYPLNPDNYGFTATRNNMSATYLNTLATLHDPRTFIVADPAPAKIVQGYNPDDFEAYAGANSGESLDDMSTKMLNGEYSPISKSKYYGSYLGEPTIQIGYAEQCFNIAEAINRGWITGNAEDYYIEGIQASWTFHGADVSTDWTSYYNQGDVAYSGNNPQGLNQIILQKYLGFFQNSGWEAYYNYRRTGIPEFLTGPGTANSGRIPKRWQYPLSERTANVANYETSLQSQFGTINDDINDEMWVIK
jgi:hypothetical protein